MLVPGAADWLAPHGVLVLECAPDQVETLVERCEAAGFQEVEPIRGPRRPPERRDRPPPTLNS